VADQTTNNSFPDSLTMPDGAQYSARYPMAMAYAAVKHAAQARKDAARTPYIGHPVAVSMLVFGHLDADGMHAGDVPEDLAIAALLHDVAEDAGGQEALNEIAALFGDRVAEIVDHCSDAKPEPGTSKGPWRTRKESHVRHVTRLAHLSTDTGDAGACLVIACDKLHNLGQTAADVRRVGVAAMDRPRFTGGIDGTRWYYRALRDALAPAIPLPLLAELDDQLAAIGA
jgi:(p)ppGpp synthase/HD superfamily hydrolase